MKNEHIIGILEEQPLSQLSEGQRVAIGTHIGDCPDCLKAWQAARLGAEVLRARAAEVIEPTPFFKTRVMAALRAREAEQSFSFGALWKAARAAVASMVALVVILLTLNFYLGKARIAPSEVSENGSLYSAERVILDNSSTADDWTDEEVLSTLYEAR
jgi:hypothetical protein